MGKELRLTYDSEGDILYIDTTDPHENQRTDAVADGVIVRSDNKTGAVEHVEIWGFLARVSTSDGLRIPVIARLREAVAAPGTA